MWRNTQVLGIATPSGGYSPGEAGVGRRGGWGGLGASHPPRSYHPQGAEHLADGTIGRRQLRYASCHTGPGKVVPPWLFHPPPCILRPRPQMPPLKL